jgi:hypothetical protein
MIEVTVTTNKGKQEILVPQSWHEVTTENFQKLYSITDENPASIFAALCGLPDRFLYDTSSDKLTQSLFSITSFISDQSFKNNSVPEFVLIKAKHGETKIALPNKVGQLSVGQNIHIKQKLDESKTYEECISWALAVYLQPIYYKHDFDYEQVLLLHDKILQTPITQTFALGFFLLNRVPASGLPITSYLSLTSIRYLVRRWSIGRRLARWQRRSVYDLTSI